jgi:hypothetical protein
LKEFFKNAQYGVGLLSKSIEFKVPQQHPLQIDQKENNTLQGTFSLHTFQ